jgi:phosphoglycolate phosphatase-like HAD superfamily hydrolase
MSSRRLDLEEIIGKLDPNKPEHYETITQNYDSITRQYAVDFARFALDDARRMANEGYVFAIEPIRYGTTVVGLYNVPRKYRPLAAIFDLDGTLCVHKICSEVLKDFTIFSTSNDCLFENFINSLIAIRPSFREAAKKIMEEYEQILLSHDTRVSKDPKLDTLDKKISDHFIKSKFRQDEINDAADRAWRMTRTTPGAPKAVDDLERELGFSNFVNTTNYKPAVDPFCENKVGIGPEQCFKSGMKYTKGVLTGVELNTGVRKRESIEKILEGFGCVPSIYFYAADYTQEKKEMDVEIGEKAVFNFSPMSPFYVNCGLGLFIDFSRDRTKWQEYYRKYKETIQKIRGELKGEIERYPEVKVYGDKFSDKIVVGSPRLPEDMTLVPNIVRPYLVSRANSAALNPLQRQELKKGFDGLEYIRNSIENSTVSFESGSQQFDSMVRKLYDEIFCVIFPDSKSFLDMNEVINTDLNYLVNSPERFGVANRTAKVKKIMDDILSETYRLLIVRHLAPEQNARFDWYAEVLRVWLKNGIRWKSYG